MLSTYFDTMYYPYDIMSLVIPIMLATFGIDLGKGLLAIFQVMKYDGKCGTCLHKFDCSQTTLSNAANHFKIFLIEFEIIMFVLTSVLLVY